MKKSLFTFLLSLMIGNALNAQLSGIKTIGIDYPTIAAAITALNASGVTAPGVTFNVPAEYKEPFSGPQDGYITTLTGSSASPIIFQKTGTGTNPLITAPAGTGTMDAIIAIGGCDYVTFNGIDLQENIFNVSSTTRMEWGYAILKASETEGSQHITIMNCSISLNKANTASTGIYSNNHRSNSTTQLVITSATGSNSYLKFFGNTIANCYFGIYVKGYNSGSPYALYDQGNEIGKDGANIITNVGGSTVEAYGIYAIYQNNLAVANNSVASTMAGTKNHYGIYLTTSLNASYDLYSNVISLAFNSTDGNNAGLYPIYCDMGGSGTTNTVNIYNNKVTRCKYPTNIQANVYMMYLANLGVTANIYGNEISYDTIGSATVLAKGLIRYLWCQKSSTVKGPMVIHDNIVKGNARMQVSPGTGSNYLIAASGSGTMLSLYNNVADSNRIGSTSTSYGLYVTFSDETSKNVYGNTISNMTEANGGVFGLYNSSGNLGYFYGNRVRNIVAAPNADAMIIGIEQVSGTTMYYYNNMVSEIYAPGSVGTLGYNYTKVIGINVQSGGTTKGFYYNTVYLDATTTSAAFGSAAFGIYSNGVGIELVNNILVNVSAFSGTYGVTAAIRARYATIPAFNSNYNLLYAGVPGPNNQIFLYGTGGTYYGAQTLAEYKSMMETRDLQSVTELPPFVNVASAPYDLKMLASAPTQCEAGGTIITTPFSIVDDFTGEARFPNAGYPAGAFSPHAPDIGADEFGGTPNDLMPPAIVYTPLLFTNSTAPRTLTATITDGSGVGTLAGLPVLYWKINNGSYQAATGTPGADNTYSFTFGSGVALHDLVSYYIVAQDASPAQNTGVFPWQGASGFSVNPPACSTPPSSPSSYYVMEAISGLKHVGVGKDYETLTAAAADLNDKYMTGPVTFIMDDASYPSETFPIIFNARPGNTAANTLTIKPNAGATPVISGSSPSTGLIIFKGLDYATIDGSNSGGADKSLTFENTSSSPMAHTIGITNDGLEDPSTNVTLKNCIFLGNNTNIVIDTYVILFNENAGLNGGGYDNCLITNNLLMRSKHGIQVQATLNKINRNIVISNNTIGSANVSDYITRWGINIEQSDNTLITANEIMGPATGSSASAMFGVLYWNNCSNTKITGNRIHDWYAMGLGSVGIKCDNNNNATATQITNNVIYNIKTPGLNPGVSQNMACGIFVRSGGNIKMWNNSIYLSGPFLNGSDGSGPSSSCITIYGPASPVGQFDIRNNILRNSMTNPSPGAVGSEGRAYGIMIAADDEAQATAAFTQLDYNDYYIDGFNGSIAQWWISSGAYGGIYPTLASWQTFTGKETHSLTLNPAFASETSLVPTNINLNSVGSNALVFTDIMNNPRYNPCDMGAYEWSMPVTDYHTLAATEITQTSATLNGDLNTQGEVVETYLVYGTSPSYGNYGNPSGYGIPPYVRTTSLVPLNAPITGLTPNTTYHFGLLGYPSTSNQSPISGNDLVFTTLPLAPAVVTVAATGVTIDGATMNGSVNANGASSSVSFEYGLTTGYGSIAAATPSTVTGSVATPVSALLAGLIPNTLYHYRAVGVNTGGSGYGADMTFTTNCIRPTITVSGPTLVCQGTTSAVYTTEAGNSNYQWSISAGGNITAGAGTYSVTVTWQAGGAQSVSVNYANQYGCEASVPASYNVTVDPLPGMAGGITGPAVVGSGQTGVAFSVTAIANATGYAWSLPSGATIASGANTASITVDFSLLAMPGQITVQGTNSCGNGQASPAHDISVIPLNLTVENVTINSGESHCYDAVQTLTIAGNGHYFEVMANGSATMIAGSNILYLPGTIVHNGGNMHGYITTDGQYCTLPLNPLVSAGISGTDEAGRDPETANTHQVTAFPNPAKSMFTIELTGNATVMMNRVVIYGMNGMKYLEQSLPDERTHTFSITHFSPGVYFVHISTGAGSEIVKLIIL